MVLLFLGSSLWICCRAFCFAFVSKEKCSMPTEEKTEAETAQEQNRKNESDPETKSEATGSDEPTKTAEDSSISGSSNTMDKENHTEMPDHFGIIPKQNEEDSEKIPPVLLPEESDEIVIPPPLPGDGSTVMDQGESDQLDSDNTTEVSEVPPSYAVHVHHYEITEEKESGCKEEGFLIFSCACGEKFTEIIPSKGHDMEAETDLFGDGLTLRCQCRRCGAYVIRNAVTAQEEYYWISWKDAEENACYVTVDTYEACKAKEEELLSQHLPCNWGNGYKETIIGWEYTYSPDY